MGFTGVASNLTTRYEIAAKQHQRRRPARPRTGAPCRPGIVLALDSGACIRAAARCFNAQPPRELQNVSFTGTVAPGRLQQGPGPGGPAQLPLGPGLEEGVPGDHVGRTGVSGIATKTEWRREAPVERITEVLLARLEHHEQAGRTMRTGTGSRDRKRSGKRRRTPRRVPRSHRSRQHKTIWNQRTHLLGKRTPGREGRKVVGRVGRMGRPRWGRRRSHPAIMTRSPPAMA